MERIQFGQKLKISRKTAGLTQQQLGDLTGVGQVVIANYERGARFPGEDMLRQLAESLNVSLDYLLSVKRKPGRIDAGGSFRLDDLFAILEKKPVSMAWNYILVWKMKRSLRIEEIYSDILIPLLRRTGDLWFSGRYSVTDEHIASGKIRELVTLAAAEEGKWAVVPDAGKRWIGLCAPGEKHDLVVLMTARLLQLRGWDVRFIGIDMPVSDLARYIDAFKPDVLSISVTIDSFREGLETYLDVLFHERKEDYAVILGGAAARRGDSGRLPGVTAVAGDLLEGIELAEKHANLKGASRK